jgi:magnesium transporter
MNPDVVAVQAGMTKVEALREVTRLAEETDDFYMIYVVDEERHLIGFVSFKELFRAKSHALIRDIMNSNVVSVTVDTDQEHVAKLVSRYNVPTLPVVDLHNRLVGTVTFDDIMDVMEEESTEDILLIAGVSDSAGVRDGMWASMRTRLPWLMVNLGTASLSGFVVSLFSSTIDRVVILASFMPIIAGIAGNGATQTLAVTIRRISTEGIPAHKALRVILKELFVGGANGVILGVIASIAATLIAVSMGSSPIFGAVIFGAMCTNMLISGLAGSSIPIALERLGADPAVASSILITAITDVLGFTLLLGLASLVL